MNTSKTAETSEGNALKIALTQGQFAIVDASDYPNLSRFKWRVDHGYARRSVRINGQMAGSEFMARRILGLQAGDVRKADHVNHDTLDNRRSNLRIVTNRQNGANLKHQSKHGTGISFTKRNGKRPFSARALVHIGNFATKEEAAKAREAWWQHYNTTKGQ